MARYRSAAELGLMQGNPPQEGARVTLANYDREPNPRWSRRYAPQA